MRKYTNKDRLPIKKVDLPEELIEKLIDLGIRSILELQYKYNNIVKDLTKDEEKMICDMLNNLNEKYLFSHDSIIYGLARSGARNLEMLLYWHSGMTMKQIAEIYNIGRQRVSQVIHKIQWTMMQFDGKLKYVDDSVARLPLSTRALHCLGRKNIKSMTELKKAFRDGSILLTRTLGVETLMEIARCVDKLEGTNIVETIGDKGKEMIAQAKNSYKVTPINFKESEKK